MSGSNPFRRKQAAQDVAGESNSVDAARARSLEIEIPPPQAKSKGKRVRIISPHSAITFDSGDDASISADDSQSRQAIPTALRSPPPVGSLHSILSKGGKINPFDLELSESSDEDDSPLMAVQGDVESIEIRGSLPSTVSENHFDGLDGIGKAVGPVDHGINDVEVDKEKSLRKKGTSKRKVTEIPLNLFPSTSGRKQSPRGSPLRADIQDFPESNASIASAHRTPMDVDAFKRLLMTGVKDSVPTTSMSTPMLNQYGSQGDSSSNTDTSSLSRNSILDSQTDPNRETPDSSQDITPLDEEGFSAFKPRPGKSEPPTPPRRRGSDLGRPQSSRARDEQSASISSKIASSRSLSVVTDLSKSPSAHTHTEVATSKQPDSPSSNTFSAASRQRVAPPPPLSRRNSQVRSKQQQFHGMTASIAEEILPPSESIDPSPPAINKAPAPPPPRRKGTERAVAISVDAGAPSNYESKPYQNLPRAPLPPPSRSGSKAKASKPVQTLSIARSTTIPPPPPPRHRASSGSSLASQRASTEIITSSNESQPMGSQLNLKEEQSKNPEDAKDILADLSALQKELDAYRTTFRS